MSCKTNMTDLELQQALYEHVRSFLKDQGLEFPYSNQETVVDEETGEENEQTIHEWKPFNVYKQDKPYKTDENDEDEENYILIILNDEDGEERSEDWIVEVQFIVGIELYEDDHQGNLIIANVMNKLWHYLRTHKIDGADLDRHDKAKRFNQENYPNFYEGALITKWRIRDVQVAEGTEEFL